MPTTELQNHLNAELYDKLSQTVSHHYIASENPEHHWHLLEVKDQIVLDLGCGFHMLESGWLSTPEYFMSKGATKIIGVDPEGNDIRHLQASFPNHVFCQDMVTTTDQLENYINTNGITALKMDIEGHETCFINSNHDFPSLKHIAIETHSRELLNLLIPKLLERNFKIKIVCTFYPRVYEICNLVYASRD